MVLIDQVVGEIIVNNVCVLCEFEKKNWINRLETYKELDYTMIILLIGAVLTNPN